MPRDPKAGASWVGHQPQVRTWSTALPGRPQPDILGPLGLHQVQWEQTAGLRASQPCAPAPSWPPPPLPPATQAEWACARTHTHAHVCSSSGLSGGLPQPDSRLSFPISLFFMPQWSGVSGSRTRESVVTVRPQLSPRRIHQRHGTSSSSWGSGGSRETRAA